MGVDASRHPLVTAPTRPHSHTHASRSGARITRVRQSSSEINGIEAKAIIIQCTATLVALDSGKAFLEPKATIGSTGGIMEELACSIATRRRISDL